MLVTFFSVGLRRLELPTSRLSGVRSNRLSYKPIQCFLNTSAILQQIFAVVNIFLDKSTIYSISLLLFTPCSAVSNIPFNTARKISCSSMRNVGLEPTRHKTREPKSRSSANSDNSAYMCALFRAHTNIQFCYAAVKSFFQFYLSRLIFYLIFMPVSSIKAGHYRFTSIESGHEYVSGILYVSSYTFFHAS